MDHGVLLRYRVMAYVTAVLLIVLVFVGLPLQAAGHSGVAHVVGTAHGFLFIVYLLVAFELTRKMRIPIVRTFMVLLAGTVPFGAIVAERKLTSLYSRREAWAQRASSEATLDHEPQGDQPNSDMRRTVT